MRLLRRFIVAVAFAVLVASTTPAGASAPGPLGALQSKLSSMSRHAPGNVGIMVEDLATGYSSSVNAGVAMPAASTIKIPVMVEVFTCLEAGAFDLNRLVTLQAGDRDWGWGDLADARPGARYTVEKLLALMITESDNTATNMLIRLVGRGAINAEMAALGLRQTRLGDYIRSDGPIRYELRSSARDMVTLLTSMARLQLVDEWSSREMIGILTGQHHNGLLPASLPPGTPIAHKTGELHDTLNDVGIVYLSDEPYAIAVMATNLPTLDAGYRFIHGVSRLAYDELSRFISWREANEPGATIPFVVAAPHRLGAPAGGDLQMWSPPDPPANALPLTTGPAEQPPAT